MTPSQSSDLKTHAMPVDEVFIYLPDPSAVLDHLDLGSADLMVFKGQDGKSYLAITTSSGHAALLPADFFAALV